MMKKWHLLGMILLLSCLMTITAVGASLAPTTVQVSGTYTPTISINPIGSVTMVSLPGGSQGSFTGSAPEGVAMAPGFNVNQTPLYLTTASNTNWALSVQDTGFGPGSVGAKPTSEFGYMANWTGSGWSANGQGDVLAQPLFVKFDGTSPSDLQIQQTSGWISFTGATESGNPMSYSLANGYPESKTHQLAFYQNVQYTDYAVGSSSGYTCIVQLTMTPM